MAGTQKRRETPKIWRETPKIWRELESSRDRLRTTHVFFIDTATREKLSSPTMRHCAVIRERGFHLVFGARGVGVIVIARAGLGGDRVRMRLRNRRKPCAAPLVFLEREQKLITCSGFTRLWQTETD